MGRHVTMHIEQCVKNTMRLRMLAETQKWNEASESEHRSDYIHVLE